MDKRVVLACVLLPALVIIMAPKAAPDRHGRDLAPPAGDMLVADPRSPSWLMRKGGAHVFISGPGDPEDFLYRGVRRADGTRDGDQERLIRKLIEHGGNCIYMQAVRSHGGDGKPDHNPFIDSDPSRGVSAPIIDQWERWFDLVDRNRILIYLFVYDDSARVWNTGDTVGAEERSFLQALVRRFRHHDNLIWVVAEEAEEAYTVRRCQAIADVIAAADRPGRIIANHHHSGTELKSWRPGGAITQFAMQLNVPLDEVHTGALEAYRRAAGRYGVLYAENTEMADADADMVRRFIWASAMAGVMPMLYGCDIASTPPAMLRMFRIQQRFFEATDYHTMIPHDELASEDSTWVLANPGKSYIIYAEQTNEQMGLRDAPRGTYVAEWTDTVTGTSAARRRLFHSGGPLRLTVPQDIAHPVVRIRRR
ncbi:MAG: DUF4038 domain-containing protein [Chthonomonadales bacterium]|nr:DUF4038 domain-containing protein [Chthonomonadales bacterium]